MSHKGYKRCGDYVVQLKIIGENNENRDHVYDKKYAKFRTSKALVEEIFNLDQSVSNISKVTSDRDPTFVYEKGKVVEVKDFYPYLNEVCSEGIHYFLSFEAAEFYGDRPEDYTGEWKSWHHNGRLEYQGEFKKGVEDGIHKCWYENGQLYSRGEWKNGGREGLHEDWYENGQLEYRGEWKNGVEEGIPEVWNDYSTIIDI